MKVHLATLQCLEPFCNFFLANASSSYPFVWSVCTREAACLVHLIATKPTPSICKNENLYFQGQNVLALLSSIITALYMYSSVKFGTYCETFRRIYFDWGV